MHIFTLASGNTTSRVCGRCRSGEMLGSRYASEIPALGHDLGWRRNLCSWKQRKNSGIPTLDFGSVGATLWAVISRSWLGSSCCLLEAKKNCLLWECPIRMKRPGYLKLYKRIVKRLPSLWSSISSRGYILPKFHLKDGPKEHLARFIAQRGDTSGNKNLLFGFNPRRLPT
jgi:hypothetical protein